MEYSFDVELAKDYGVEEAIFIKNFQFWIHHNKTNNKHFYDGRTWTYNSQKAFTEQYPFWSRRQIQRILYSLIEQNVIIVGNYNEKGYDKTNWYGFKDEAKWLQPFIVPNGASDCTEPCNPLAETVQPIPDSKPDIKPDSTAVSPKKQKTADRKRGLFSTPADNRISHFLTEYHPATYSAHFGHVPLVDFDRVQPEVAKALEFLDTQITDKGKAYAILKAMYELFLIRCKDPAFKFPYTGPDLCHFFRNVFNAVYADVLKAKSEPSVDDKVRQTAELAERKRRERLEREKPLDA